MNESVDIQLAQKGDLAAFNRLVMAYQGTAYNVAYRIMGDGENGYLVPPGDADALAEALIRLLDEAGERRSFGEAAYRLVMQEYTWERVGKRIRENITSVLDAAESGDQQETSEPSMGMNETVRGFIQ